MNKYNPVRIIKKVVTKSRLFLFALHNTIRYGNTPLFRNVEIETSSKCNRRCPYCPNSRFDRGNYLMSLDTYKKIINELKNVHYSGVIRLHFYNEPLLDKRLPQLIALAKNNLPSCSFHIYSNGDFLTESLLRKLLQAGMDKIFITGHEGFLRNELIKLSQNPRYVNNVHTSIIVNGMPLFNRGGLVNVKKIIRAKTCNLAADYLIVDHRGNVVLCCNDYLSSQIFGNINEERIIDIWRKKEYKMIRETTKDGIFLLEICKRCMGISNRNTPPVKPVSG